MTLASATMLNIMQQSCEAVLTLTEDVAPEDFFSSQLTQAESLRHLRIIAENVDRLPMESKTMMAEIDWAGWNVLLSQVRSSGGFERDAIWFAIRSMVPATLIWLRVFRQQQPDLFRMTL
jgi:uncharacterized protein with HEPN domain